VSSINKSREKSLKSQTEKEAEEAETKEKSTVDEEHSLETKRSKQDGRHINCAD
jgi:hypothetical protein